MHVMVATDGSLDAARAADFATRLAGEGGRVTVFSAVEMPRALLNDMRAEASSAHTERARQLNVEYQDSPASEPPSSTWVGDDAVVDRYVSRRIRDRTNGLAAALDARGTEYEIVGVEAPNPARSILDAIAERDVDVLCVGTHGLGMFEGLLGSISTKLARRAPCTVMLIR